MTNLNDAFRANPLDFARKYAIDAGGAEPLAAPVASTAGVKVKGPEDGRLLQVTGAKRIYGCEIALNVENPLAQDALHSPIGRARVRLRQVGAADSFPIYWLPWVRNGLIRTALRPRRAVHNPQEDPDFFFTAGLNGCVVFVEGQRDQPTVYHANASSTHGPDSPIDSPGALFGAGSDGLARACIQAKVDNMVERYRRASLAHPKLARNEANPAVARPALPATAGAVTQKDYLAYGVGPPDDEKAALSAALGAQATTGRADEIRIEEGLGTVFGVRDGAGLWTFHFQKTVAVVRTRFTKRSAWAQHMRGKDEWKPHVLPVEWVVTQAKQFWPNVGGAARFEIGRGVDD